MTQVKSVSSDASSWHGWGLLLTVLMAMSVIWCGLLPWIATRPHVQRQLTFLDERGIDPSAMFYTELDAMDAILERAEGDGDHPIKTKKPAE
ncbi:MAG: hypothetical protein KDA93_13175 [Planctomycetaceae bacterium]|nr:hypothetical protein [Planctomycetaceae bacterium]